MVTGTMGAIDLTSSTNPMSEPNDLCCMINPTRRCYYCSAKACSDCADKALKAVPIGGNTIYDIMARACTARQENIGLDGHDWVPFSLGIL
jgi:hypothetical protein